jgi:hypothetical protein
LVVSSHQVDFGEDGTTEKLVGVIIDMPDLVAVGNGTGVEGFVIATGTPPVIVVGYDVEPRRRRAIPSRNMASNSALAIASRSGEPCIGSLFMIFGAPPPSPVLLIASPCVPSFLRTSLCGGVCHVTFFPFLSLPSCPVATG